MFGAQPTKEDAKSLNQMKPASGISAVMFGAQPTEEEAESLNQIKNEVIKPTINGVLSIMKSCKKAGTVKRVIFTSSASTVNVQEHRMPDYSDNSWSDIDFCRRVKMTGWTCFVSKTLAEKAAWNFAEENDIHLISIIPTSVEGWCDSVGSLEDIQAKLLKRQDAAAKRERAMAYAPTHQWQAGSRQADLVGFEPDKNNWGWNWLERWMAVRPWENRFLDIKVQDGMSLNESGFTEGNNEMKTQFKPTSKRPTSKLHSNISNKKTGPSHSEGSASSSSLSAGKMRRMPSFEEVVGEVMSKPSGLGPRSYSRPKERPGQQDIHAKMRRSSLQSPCPGAGKHRLETTSTSRRTHRRNSS